MRPVVVFAFFMACAGISRAGDLSVRVLLSGEVAPGVYGQVQFGAEPPPAVLYAQPMLIERQAVPPPPVYLHVPPGHAKNWRKHCREYHACNRPVYFVRSAEYEPGFDRRRYEHEKEHGHHHGDDHRRDRGEHDH